MMKAELIPTADKLLTYNEAAAYMRCSKVFIWKRRKEGKLAFIRAGSKVLFQKSAIDSYLNINNRGGHHAN
jgi:excisionase family DNA binding protein